jgi:glutathione peroxidase
MSELLDLPLTTLDGEPTTLGALTAGRAALVVNVASRCGLTPQYGALEALHEEYADRGFTVIGVPCNQFGGQEPGTEEEIGEFCQKNYGVSFPMYAKVDVNGDDEHPLWAWLKSEKGGLLGDRIKWNFTKFLVGRDGAVIERFSPQTEPADLATDIEKALAG